MVKDRLQRVANKMRVNSQLIDARAVYLEAQTYNDLTDVFAIRNEAVKTIAEQLKGNSSPNQGQA